MQKSRKRLVIFALVTTVILSCGIPTSIPILPKEVVVKASPSVSVPLGRVNYNLYSGLSGGNMKEKFGDMDNLLGASWLQDLQEQGATIYDYRPSGSKDDTQKFLIHYKLDMEDTLDSPGEVDLSEYKKMLDDLTGVSHDIAGMEEPFTIPEVDETPDPFKVIISLEDVTGLISNTLSSLWEEPPTAFLPVINASMDYDFPDLPDFDNLPPNSDQNFFVTLQGLDSITLKKGELFFDFTLLPNNFFPQGSRLEISEFELWEKKEDNGDCLIEHVTVDENKVPVVLDSLNVIRSVSISFNQATLPHQFYLACRLKIVGTGFGIFELAIEPRFEEFIISGVKDLELDKDEIEKLQSSIEETEIKIGDSLKETFEAEVKEGSLKIDAAQNLFPPLQDPPDPTVEGWNLTMNLSALTIKQEDLEYSYPHKTQDNPPVDVVVDGVARGLSLSGLRPGPDGNSLTDKFLNSNPVIIKGRVFMSVPQKDQLPDGGGKLTFNFPDGITGESYEKDLLVNLKVNMFSAVKLKAEDIGLGEIVDKTIEQDLEDDFISFKDWLNYIQFAPGSSDDPERGLGLALKIKDLNIVEGLNLIINAPVFGLNETSRSLKTGKDIELVFTNEDSEGYKLEGYNLPEDKLRIDVKLGLQKDANQTYYKETGILTLENVEPGFTVTMEGAKARLLFNWDFMSVKPQETKDHETLPDYPFKGIYPDKDKGEEGIDLSDIPKGLGFYIPEGENKAGEGINANLYISLKRQQQLTDGNWVDEPAGDPGGDYDKADPYGWARHLKVNLPDLDFHAIYGGKTSENLFLPNHEAKSTGDWALFRPLNLEAQEFAEQGLVKKDENKDNPFKIYTGSTLPEQDKAIPIENLAKVFNDNLAGEKDLYFEYEVKLSSAPNDEPGSLEPEEIRLYPDILKKRIAVSVDLLIVVPLKFMAIPDPDNPDAPVVITLDPDLGDDDLFGRKTKDDNEYFDLVNSLGFDINIENMAGLSAGRFYLENKTNVEAMEYRTSRPIIDFSTKQNKFSLDSGELEKLKAIWPFTPQVAIEFAPQEVVRIQQNFNIKLQSITIKAGGEYTFETGW